MFFLDKSRLHWNTAVSGLCLAASLFLPVFSVSVQAQDRSSSSSSSSSSRGADGTVSKDIPATNKTARIAQVEASGSAVTLETSEPLFYLATALNTCGYDADLAASSPVRMKVRDEVNAELAAGTPEARDSRDKLCAYVREHTLNGSGLNLAQYISLALYVKQPPELTPSVDETELPPDAAQVVNILPLLRTFAEEVRLHAIWVEHRPEYEALENLVHDPLTHTVLDTNIYLRMPVSSYDGRRFMVLLEPMLAPSATNARIYASDYVIVVSPAAQPAGSVHMNDIRHIYLHYMIEPLVYGRASAMERLAPLLKPVQDAPIEFTYKNDIVPLITECLIKAVEAHTMDVGLVKPKPTLGARERAELEKYDVDMAAYQRQAEAVRRKAVALDVRQGWILVSYFYDKLTAMEKDGVSLKEDIGEMVYGMDVDRERHAAQQVVFLPESTHDVLRPSAPRQPAGMDLAEMKVLKGDVAGAAEMAKSALADPKGDHARAHYVLAQVNLMQRQPGAAIEDFQATLSLSKDPRTLAWSHIYLGRLYDVQADRQKAVDEYQAALKVRDSQPDTKAAAEKGLKEPFVAPGAERSGAERQGTERKPQAEDDSDAPLDPSGKAEKDAYKPSAPPK